MQLKEWKYQADGDCYCMEGLIYCDKLLDPEKQSMNIYVPAAYIRGESLTTRHGATYTAKTVPVVYYNDVGGYAECRPAPLTMRNRRFLEDGYVLVSAGARGRQTVDENRESVGKSPAGLVDLKAGIRFLRRFADSLPGDMNKIVSVGTSAGGAMSSLLGVTGNSENYLPYLKEIGAAKERDDIFAAQCYCPIINLENADMAYEWMFGCKQIYRMFPHMPVGVLSPAQKAISRDLAAQFPAYINSLSLGLTLSEDGRSGSYYDALMDALSASVNKFLDIHSKTAEEKTALVEEINGGGDLIQWDGENAKITDLDKYVRIYIDRMKECPSFDGLFCRTPENEVFGFKGRPFTHFDRRLAALVAEGRYDSLPGFNPADKASYAVAEENEELQRRVYLYNPMNYLGTEEKSDIAPHIRIRLGSRDADTSFGIALTLAQKLKATGHPDTDYALIWGRGHCDADYAGEFSEWVDRVAR